MKSLRGSWRTTAVAVTAALSAVMIAVSAVIDGDGAAVDWDELRELVIAALIAVGFYAARDNKVSSEEAGATE